jgi:hypothetical protein
MLAAGFAWCQHTEVCRVAGADERTADRGGGAGDEYQLCNSTNLLVAGYNQWDK